MSALAPVCSNGHPCVHTTSSNGRYKAGWTCDKCQKPYEPSHPRYACEACSVDLCANCAPMFTKKSKSSRSKPFFFLNPVTKQREPLLTKNSLRQWVGPDFVEDMIGLKFTYISDEHKKMIQDCVHWAIPALKWSAEDQDIKLKCRRLLGTFQFTQCLSWAQPSWPTLMEGLNREMALLGDELDTFYRENDLANILGSFKPKMLQNTNHRQDCPGGLPSPPYFQNSEQQELKNHLWRFEPVTLGHEIAYIHFLRLVGVAIKDEYCRDMEKLFGDLLINQGFIGGGIKGYERMQNKLKSFVDHWSEELPRPAENVDVVRGLAVFEDASKMSEGLLRLQTQFKHFVKFKNGMAWSPEQAKKAKHLRLVLACVLYSPRIEGTKTPMTFGDLCASPRVQQLWEEYCGRDPPASNCIDEGVVGAGPWHRSIALAKKWLESPDIRARQVSMVCEVQMVLENYLHKRQAMHEMYKVVRADNAVRLHADFVSSQKSALAQAEDNKDKGMKLNKTGGWKFDDTTYAKFKRIIFEEEVWRPSREIPLSCSACEDAHEDDEHGDDDDDDQERHFPMAQVARADGPYVDGWFCNACGRDGNKSEERHHCTLCCRDICYDCEPLATDPRLVGLSFEDQLRSMMKQLQTLTLSQCAGLVSVACIRGKVNVVKVLLDMIRQFEDSQAVQAMLSSSGAGYHFPLFNAAVCKRSAHRVEIMRVLLDAKADPHQKTNGGCSSLWKAANSGYKDSVQLLLDCKADVNAMQESTTITPLYNACYRGHDEIAALLIEHGGDVNQVRKTTGATPLYTACENAHSHIVVTLIAHKASVNQCTTKNHSSPMYIAAQNGHLEIIHILAEAKANPHLGRSADGCTPLYAAADKGYGLIVKYINALIQNNGWDCQCEGECHCGINVLCQNNHWCPVNIAAYRGFFPCVRTLVELGANQRSIKMGIERSSGPHAAAIKEFLESHLVEPDTALDDK